MYDSLKASGEVSEETLAHFDSEGAENLLYEMRFLAATRRVEPAKYIVANNLDARVRVIWDMDPTLTGRC